MGILKDVGRVLEHEGPREIETLGSRRAIGRQARSILRKGIGTPVEHITTHMGLGRDMVYEAIEQERRAAELLRHRAAGYVVPAGTRHLSSMISEADEVIHQQGIAIGHAHQIGQTGHQRWEASHVGQLMPPVPEGHTRLFRGTGIQGPGYWNTPVNMSGHTAETHERFRNRWFTAEPDYSIGYAVKQQSARMDRGLVLSDEERRMARFRDPWGSMSYMDIPSEDAQAHFLRGAGGQSEYGFGPEEDISPIPVFSGGPQKAAANDAQARIMTNVAASKDIRAARMQRSTESGRLVSQEREKVIARHTRRHSTARHGLPVRSSAPARFPGQGSYTMADALEDRD